MQSEVHNFDLSSRFEFTEKVWNDQVMFIVSQLNTKWTELQIVPM